MDKSKMFIKSCQKPKKSVNLQQKILLWINNYTASFKLPQIITTDQFNPTKCPANYFKLFLCFWNEK